MRVLWAAALLLAVACAGSSAGAGADSNPGRDGSGRLQVVLVTGEGGSSRPYLEMALRAGDDIELATLTASELQARLAARSLPPGAVIVLDGVTPAALPPPVRLLLFRPAGEHSPFRVGRELGGVTVTRVRDGHEVMRGVHFADSRLEAATALELDARRGDVALAAAGADPVIAARSSGQGRTIACGFRPGDTTWVLQSAFAVFVHNAIAWLAATR